MRKVKKKIIVIGTLHAGLTSHAELKEILEEYKPNQLLVEISQNDIKQGKINSYPSEMVFAYNWAKKNKIRVDGFDSKINTFRAGVTKEDNNKAIKEQKEIMKHYSWKEMNQSINNQKLKTKTTKNLDDSEKLKKLNFEMLNNIKKLMIKEGIIVILTGCGHLDFFEQHLKNAIFPFRLR